MTEKAHSIQQDGTAYPAQRKEQDMSELLPYRREGDFGFTNDLNLLKAEQFRDAAKSDGWEMRAT